MKITVNGNISQNEIDAIIAEEKERFAARGKEIATIEISEISPKELEVKTRAKSDIRRIRRITGYLSTVDRFNDAKQEELKNRVVHF
ncbi:anaerobic ribonucleoside-triphosphate reductase [Desulfotomaculum nigrificans]|uniref:anaerobic ribonucleoside-triphosphate reductase n=1 Tax=Desulfotomaculum nigrificans TaxID=1565 RepID=UPI0001FAE9DC|nr:anaerobic ribonucleoside-triphosphate reductase [Desulfotomaculum nigrificans]